MSSNLNTQPDLLKDETIQYKNISATSLIPQLLRAYPLEVLKNLMVEQGGLVKLNIGPKEIYIVSDPNAFQRILRDKNKNYEKPEMLYGVAKQVVKNGLLTSEGEFWLRQRRLIQPYMHHKYISSLAETMASSIKDNLDDWDSFIKSGKPIDINQQMSRITMNIVTRCMFGQNISTSDMDQVSQLLPAILSYVGTRGFLPFIPNWVPFPGDQAFNKSYSEIQAIMLRLIDQRRDIVGGTDLISMLLNSVDDETNESMTNEQLLDEAMTIFFAGYETTSTTLTWLWYVLEDHPDVLTKLQFEIDSVLEGGAPTVENVQELAYTKMVISETMRQFPPVPLLPRKSVADDILLGRSIRAGSTVLLFFYGLHHNPEVWENPDRFIPGRFSTDEIKGRSAFAWLPFSGGPRKCIGDQFAMMEAVLATAMILQRFNLSVDKENIKPRIMTTLQPSKPLMGQISYRYPP